MASYREPDLKDRQAAAAAARQRALEKLRTRAPVDEAVVAERKAALEAKRAAEQARRDEKRAAIAAAAAEKAAAKEAARIAEEQARAEAEAAAEAARKPQLTEAEKKLARDLRYAARKARVRGK